MIGPCETCLYYEDTPLGVPGGGFCHRMPPTCVIGMTQDGPRPLGSSHTPVTAKGWCGEWRQGQLIKVVLAGPSPELVGLN